MMRPSLKSIAGHILPERVKSHLGILRDRLQRPDAFVVSYPKSGRTWLQMMVARAYQQTSGLALEELLAQQHRNIGDKDTGRQVPIIRFGHGYRYKYFCQGAKFPAWYYRNARVALLVRDPRDTLVSWFYYQKYHFQSFNGSLHDFAMTSGSDRHPEDHLARTGIEPILKYYATWLENRDCFRDLLIMYYEDFRAHPETQLRRLFDFAGVSVPEDVLRDAVQFASFENMRQMEQNRTLAWNALPGGKNQRGFKTRRAQVNGFRDELCEEDLGHLNSTMRVASVACFDRYLGNRAQNSESAPVHTTRRAS
ncbi:MAG: sulfotransferase domain-containing protein [Planctomycetaceae bacterium]|nr:sulfotransferase domain-containing protein [Planctomycetaceae bacterium]